MAERDQAREALVVAALSAATVVVSTVSGGGAAPPPLDGALPLHPAVVTLVGCFGVAAVTPALVRIDVRQRRLPNPLVGVVAAAWIASLVVFVVQGGAVVAVTSLGCVVVTALAGGVAALAGGLGMGDVKLGALLSGLVSPWGGIAVLGLWGLAGASAVALAVMRRLGPGSRHARPWAGPSSSVAGVPFGPCLLGAFWAIVFGRPVLTTLVDLPSPF